MDEKIRTFVACSEPVYCEGVASILADADSPIAILGFEILGMVNLQEQLVEAASQLPVDVLVTDFCISGRGVIDSIHSLQKTNPKMTILFLIDKVVPHPVMPFLQAGTAICIPKASRCSRIMGAIIALSLGDALIDLESMKSLLNSRPSILKSSTGYVTPSGLKVVELKPDQLQVLELIAGGMSNKQIARHLAVSERTVESRLTRVFRFAGVSTRIEAIVWAIREGYIKGGAERDSTPEISSVKLT
jgi:DNA-binding NarL/FixJ family response regulator